MIFNNFYPLERDEFIWAIIFSTVAQVGDLTVSYFKREEKKAYWNSLDKPVHDLNKKINQWINK